MSWTDDELDALFKEIPSQLKPAPFQDSFFDEIEPLLPQKRSKKGLFWVLGSTLIALVSTFIYTGPAADQTASVAQENTVSGLTFDTPAVQTATHSNPGIKAKPANALPANHVGQAATSAYYDPDFEPVYLPPLASNSGISHVNADVEPAELSENKPAGQELAEVKNPVLLSNEIRTNNGGQAETDLNPAQEESIAREQKPEHENPEAEDNTGLAKTEFISPYIDATLATLGAGFFRSDSEREIQALYLPAMYRKHFLTLEAGAGFTENFIKMENSSQKPMPTANLGLSYQYRTKHLFYAAGLNWMNFSPNSLTLNRRSKVYGFEVNHYSQDIDYKWITMLEMPLSIGKRFKNQSLSVGFAPALVLGSMVDFTETENGQLTKNGRIYGNMLGMKHYAATLSLAYDLRIARNLDLGLKVSNLIVNPLDAKPFVGELNKNPFQAQITIKKHFRIK